MKLRDYYDNGEEPEKDSPARRKRALARKIKKLQKLHDNHKGEWITFEDAKEYRDRAEKMPYNGRQDIGERRALRIELQERFGLAEGEAINILNGFHMRDIVQVYDNIKNLRIPEASNTANSYKGNSDSEVKERLESDFD